jgi:hypothetical protein
MKRSTRLPHVVLAALMIAPGAAHAQWNLSNDYSASLNPNGVWVFGSRALGSLLSTGLTVYGTSSSAFGWDANWSNGSALGST